ncbi:hypothetical protein LUZ60_010745 [Juncus effusus]|nr:hypothetical protein LUZ60_010745 [Juncus effusus]
MKKFLRMDIDKNTDIVRTDGTCHRFKFNYSKMRNMTIGQLIRSPTFRSEGYQWVIHFYPKGFLTEGEGVYSSLFLKLLNDREDVNVSFSLSILERDGTQRIGPQRKQFEHIFTKSESDWGHLRFIRRTDLEKNYLTYGFFVVVCSINMGDSLPHECYCGARLDIGKLFKTGDMTDVKFKVDGEVFAAHRLILGARSSVFKSQLFGSVSDARMEFIEINDMSSHVFKALLHFIYTCSLPDDIDTDMIQHLIVAAKRYDQKINNPSNNQNKALPFLFAFLARRIRRENH